MLFLNHIKPEIRKIQNGFPRNQFTTSQILTIINGVHAKKLKATQLFVDFSKASIEER